MLPFENDISSASITKAGESNLCKRIIACLDIASGRTVKGVNFKGLVDAGDPVRQAIEYERQGADEIMFLDITASSEGRKTTVELLKAVARRLSIPLTVGGGVSTASDVAALLDAGADKVSINTAAVLNPNLIDEVARSFGSQCCVVAVDARLCRETGRWTVLVKGGREQTSLDALAWAKQCIARGAGEILLTSWDHDGTRKGFDIPLTKAFSTLPVPIVASGGAAGADCFVEVFNEGQADAALAASIFHFREWTVGRVKDVIAQKGVQVRR